MRRILSLLLVAVLSIALVACGGNNNATPVDDSLPLAGKKIAYIINVASTDIFQMAANAAVETGKALGAEVTVYFTDDDNTRFQDYIASCANQGYDAMFLSHGNDESSYDLVTDLVDKGIKVVTFDTQFVDDAGNNVTIDGVTQMFQNDQEMAAMLLDYILEHCEGERPLKIMKIWEGPGISPFDRRQEAYLEYEQKGLIETVETIAPVDATNEEGSMHDVMASILAKYPEGSFDALWGCYDAYTRGAYAATVEAGRKDFLVVSVDISNQDINYMNDGNEIWQACACVDFGTIGEQGIRILAMKLMGEETEDVYNLVPSLVTYDQLTKDTTVLNLGEVIDGYGVNNDHISDWMKDYIPVK